MDEGIFARPHPGIFPYKVKYPFWRFDREAVKCFPDSLVDFVSTRFFLRNGTEVLNHVQRVLQPHDITYPHAVPGLQLLDPRFIIPLFLANAHISNPSIHAPNKQIPRPPAVGSPLTPA